MKLAKACSQFFVICTFCITRIFQFITIKHDLGALWFENKLIQKRHSQTDTQGTRSNGSCNTGKSTQSNQLCMIVVSLKVGAIIPKGKYRIGEKQNNIQAFQQYLPVSNFKLHVPATQHIGSKD